jgi:DNA-binding transcriptional regulator YiaG
VEEVKVHKWRDVRDRVIGKERAAKVDAQVERTLLEMKLKELRAELGLTQAQVAKAAKMTQSELSKAEARRDHLVSSLRRIVEALGGELRLTAVFGDREVRLEDV